MSDSEDGMPFIAKRSNISKQSQLNSDGKKSQLVKQDTQTGKQVSDSWVVSNGKLNGAQAPKLVQPRISNLPGVAEGSKSSGKQTVKLSDESDDSEDDKPLSARMGSRQLKGNPSSGISQSVKAKPAIKRDSEELDEEIPLLKRYRQNSSAGTSGPIKTPQQNGSVKKEGQLKSPAVPSKRPLENAGSSSQSAGKKAKASDGSQVVKSKIASLKDEEVNDDDHVPIAQRTKAAKPDSKPSSTNHKAKKVNAPLFKKTSSQSDKKPMKTSQYSQSSKVQPSSGDGQKWMTLVHNGVIFPPPYKPHGVKILYKGKPVDLTPEQEEVATMYAIMRDTEYLNNEEYQKTFKENFMGDWRKLLGKKHVIQDLELCDFTPIYEWHQKEKEKKKQMTSEEKKAAKEEKLKQEEKYMWAVVDGVKEKVGNFRVEPPGLFRGRGKHPKMGKLKRRIRPSDITINIGKDAPIPECPIAGESWKEIKHDNTVTWLAFWNDPINPKEFKYVFLAASSSLKGQSDKEKYEKARLLKKYIDGIRTAYSKDFGSKDITKQQIAVATYLIDKLALRAGNEKDDDEADTVGCCTLKVENVTCVGGNKLEFDFLGKDSIRYQNEVEVVPPVYKAISQFQAGKKGNEDLFDKLDTSKLNAHLKGLMPGLTAKVFRTYNASITLDEQLHSDTKDGDGVTKISTYNLANKQVAIICNHQRSVSKSHEAQVGRLEDKIEELKGQLKELQKDLDAAKKGKPPLKDKDGNRKKNLAPEVLEKKIAQATVKIAKLESDKDTKEALKTVALGTSKINYLDPRISVAWCKRHEVPIEKIFNKSLLAKFAWSLDVDPSFRF